MRQSPVDVASSSTTAVRWAALGVALAVGVAPPGVGALPVGSGAVDGQVAAFLLAGATTRHEGVVGLAGWLAAGAAIGGGLGAAVVGVAAPPLAPSAIVGLGVALGGGMGVVTNLLVNDTESVDDDSVEVDMGGDETPSPRPADLFADHPDPVLYVADEGHGPIVRAANDAFGAVFDVPTDALVGTPVDEAAMATERTDEIGSAVAESGDLDVVVDCETPEGDRPFRLRTAGGGRDCYLLYTPVET